MHDNPWDALLDIEDEDELQLAIILLGVRERMDFTDCDVYLRGYDYLLEVACAIFDELAAQGLTRVPHANRSVQEILETGSCSDSELRSLYSFLASELGFYTVNLEGPYSSVPALLTTPQEFDLLPMPVHGGNVDLHLGRLLAVPLTHNDLAHPSFRAVLERGWSFLQRPFPSFSVEPSAFRRKAPTERAANACDLERIRLQQFIHPANVLLNLDHPDSVALPSASESDFVQDLLDDELDRFFEITPGEEFHTWLPTADSEQLYLTLGARRFVWAERVYEAPLYLLPVTADGDHLRAENCSAFLNPALYVADLASAMTGEVFSRHLDPLRPVQDVRVLIRDEPDRVDRFDFVSADVASVFSSLSERMWVSLHPTKSLAQADPTGAAGVVDLVAAGVNLLYFDNRQRSRRGRMVDVAAECIAEKVLTYLVVPQGAELEELVSLLCENQLLDAVDVDGDPLSDVSAIVSRCVEEEGRIPGFDNFYYALGSEEFSFHDIAGLFRNPLTTYCTFFYGSLDKLLTEFFFPFQRILVHEAQTFPQHKLSGARFDTQVYLSYSDDPVGNILGWQYASDHPLDMRKDLKIATISRIAR